VGARRTPYFFLVILRSAFFAGRRIYGVVESIGAASRVNRSFGAKRRRLRMTSVRGRYKPMAREGFGVKFEGLCSAAAWGRAFLLVILTSALFADRRIYGVVESISAANRVHRPFGAKRRRLRMTACGEDTKRWREGLGVKFEGLCSAAAWERVRRSQGTEPALRHHH
jgi:hypothetical protein